MILLGNGAAGERGLRGVLRTAKVHWVGFEALSPQAMPAPFSFELGQQKTKGEDGYVYKMHRTITPERQRQLSDHQYLAKGPRHNIQGKICTDEDLGECLTLIELWDGARIGYSGGSRKEGSLKLRKSMCFIWRRGEDSRAKAIEQTVSSAYIQGHIRPGNEGLLSSLMRSSG